MPEQSEPAAPLPPYPPPIPPPPSSASLPSSFPAATPWLPTALARPPLTAPFVVSAVLQFIVATLALLATFAALFLRFGGGIGAATLAIPLGLCIVHTLGGACALQRQAWAMALGYFLVGIEAVFLLANILA